MKAYKQRYTIFGPEHGISDPYLSMCQASTRFFFDLI